MNEIDSGTYTHVLGQNHAPRTIRHYRALEATHGSLVACEMTGNQDPYALFGENCFLLAAYRLAYPKAMADEIIAFIYNHSSLPRQYSRSQSSDCERDLGLPRKVGSTTAYQAMTPSALLRRHLFWTTGYPTGILNVPFNSLIDIDEMAIMLQKVNRPCGKAYINVRVREEGAYERTTKWTLILAIAPFPYPQGRVWWRFSKDTGTTATVFRDFRDFVHEVLTDVNSNPATAFPHMALWDNLGSHITATVMNIVHSTPGGHRVVARPPYRPQDGPIEYANNKLVTLMRQHCYNITTDDELVQAMPGLIAQLNGFRETFKYCGY